MLLVGALGLNPLRSIVGRSPNSSSSSGHRALIHTPASLRAMLRTEYPTLQPCACAHVRCLCVCLYVNASSCSPRNFHGRAGKGRLPRHGLWYIYIYMCVRINVYVLCACDCEQNDIQAPTCNCMGCMPRASQDCRNNMLAC